MKRDEMENRGTWEGEKGKGRKKMLVIRLITHKAMRVWGLADRNREQK